MALRRPAERRGHAIPAQPRSCAPSPRLGRGPGGGGYRTIDRLLKLKLSPPHDLELPVEILDHGSAAFDPVATIDVAEPEAVQERRGPGLNIAEVAFYSVVVLVIMLLSVYVPA